MALFRLRKPENSNPLARQLKGEVPSAAASAGDSSVAAAGLAEWPRYSGCPEALRACAGWTSCLSVFRALGNKSAQVALRRRLQKVGAEKGWEQKLLTHEWSPKTQQWYALPPAREPDEYKDWTVPNQHLSQFVGWALARSRKTREEKLRLFALFDLQLNEQEASAVKGAVENEFLAVLSQCLPLPIEYQYRVGKYRLDAFIPRLRLAVMIDEHGHDHYDPQEEKTYDEVLRDNNIVCLRFNPHQKYGATPPQYELVRQVWERTLSPDFLAFRERNKLV